MKRFMPSERTTNKMPGGGGMHQRGKGSIAKIISPNNKKDHIVVSLNDLPNGLYLCILYANNQKIDALKLSKVAY